MFLCGPCVYPARFLIININIAIMITEGGKSTVFSDVVTTLDWQARCYSD